MVLDFAGITPTPPCASRDPQAGARLRAGRSRGESRRRGKSDDKRSVEPPSIVLDEFFVLDARRVEDAPVQRRLDMDPATARFFNWMVEQAESQPDSHFGTASRAAASRSVSSRLMLDEAEEYAPSDIDWPRWSLPVLRP